VDKLWSESQQGQEIYLVSEISSPVLDPSQGPIPRVPEVSKLDVHESVHRDTTMKITNKMHYID